MKSYINVFASWCFILYDFLHQLFWPVGLIWENEISF